MDRQLQPMASIASLRAHFSRINVDRQLQLRIALCQLELDFSRINVDRQLQLWAEIEKETDDFSRINVDRQLQHSTRNGAHLCDFSRINVDRQLQRSGGRHAARVDFSRITMDRQRQQTACPQKRTRADREPSLPARFQHCAGQTPVCPAVRFFVFRMLEDAAEVGHVKHDHGQQTAEYAQRQARLGHVAGCYHAGGIGKGIGRITDGQTHAQ